IVVMEQQTSFCGIYPNISRNHPKVIEARNSNVPIIEIKKLEDEIEEHYLLYSWKRVGKNVIINSFTLANNEISFLLVTNTDGVSTLIVSSVLFSKKNIQYRNDSNECSNPSIRNK
ncbi:10189_t:CDS:2, partial [Gigaspora margarita]